MWWCFGVVFTGGVIGWCYQVTYLAILVSSPAYLNSLVRPERVPRNAVSTPSITLQRKHLHLQKHSADITSSHVDVLVSFDRRVVLVVFDVAMVLVVLVVFDVMLVFDLMMVFDRRVVFDVMVVLVVLVVFDVMMVFDVRVVLVVFDLMVVLGC